MSSLGNRNSEQDGKPCPHFIDDVVSQPTSSPDWPNGGVNDFDFVDQYNTVYQATGRQRNLKRPISLLASDRADDKQRRLAVVVPPRKHQRWPAPALLMADRRTEIEPKQVAGIRRLGVAYHFSSPPDVSWHPIPDQSVLCRSSRRQATAPRPPTN